MTLINSKWRRDISGNAVDAVLRVAGFGVSAVALNKLTDATFTSKSNMNQTIGNVAGPVISILGLAGDMFFANPMLRAVCQGLYSYAIPKSVAVIAPVVGEYMGLSGTPGIMNGTPGIMNGAPSLPVYTPSTQVAIGNAANTVRSNAEMTESTANNLAGTMIQN